MQTSRLTSTLRAAIRRDPAARLVDTTAGSSCGVMPTAIASENSNASRIGLCSTTLMAKIDTVRAAATYTSSIENRRSPTWNSVCGLVRAQPGGDAPELGARAGGDHDAAAAAGVHDGAHQRAPGQLRQRRAGRHRGGVFGHRQGLAGQHRLVAFQTGRRQQPDVGRDDVAEAQLDQVARDQAGHVDLDRAGRRAPRRPGGGSANAAPRRPSRPGTR